MLNFLSNFFHIGAGVTEALTHLIDVMLKVEEIKLEEKKEMERRMRRNRSKYKDITGSPDNNNNSSNSNTPSYRESLPNLESYSTSLRSSYPSPSSYPSFPPTPVTPSSSLVETPPSSAEERDKNNIRGSSSNSVNSNLSTANTVNKRLSLTNMSTTTLAPSPNILNVNTALLNNSNDNNNNRNSNSKQQGDKYSGNNSVIIPHAGGTADSTSGLNNNENRLNEVHVLIEEFYRKLTLDLSLLQTKDFGMMHKERIADIRMLQKQADNEYNQFIHRLLTINWYIFT